MPEPSRGTRWRWDGRLWHACVEGRYEMECGKRVSGDNELRLFYPSDEGACARCCRAIWGAGMGRDDGREHDDQDGLDELEALLSFNEDI